MMRRTRALGVFIALVMIAPAARAVDGISLEIGTSNSASASVDITRIGLQWNWAKRWALGANWNIGGYWEVDFGHWSNDSAQRTNSSIAEIGLTPVFRLQQTHPGAIAPYAEAAIGLHLLSETSVSQHRRFSTMFQFGDHLGLGIRFGHRHAFDLGYRYQHLSNGGIKKPNHGINFHQIRLQYSF